MADLIDSAFLGYTSAGVVMLVVSIVTIPLLFLGLFVMTVIGIVEGVLYLTKSEEQFRREYIRGRKAWF